MDILFFRSETCIEVISTTDITVGEQIFVKNGSSKPLYSTITEIVKKRPAKGTYINKPRPDWYQLNITVPAPIV